MVGVLAIAGSWGMAELNGWPEPHYTDEFGYLLAADTFDWAAQFPTMERPALQALLVATTLMQLSGPLWTTLALKIVARESNGE